MTPEEKTQGCGMGLALIGAAILVVYYFGVPGAAITLILYGVLAAILGGIKPKN